MDELFGVRRLNSRKQNSSCGVQLWWLRTTLLFLWTLFFFSDLHLTKIFLWLKSVFWESPGENCNTIMLHEPTQNQLYSDDSDEEKKRH